jgi:hypothetical protein
MGIAVPGRLGDHRTIVSLTATLYRRPLQVMVVQDERNWFNELSRILRQTYPNAIGPVAPQLQKDQMVQSEPAQIALEVVAKKVFRQQLSEKPERAPTFCLLEIAVETCVLDLELIQILDRRGCYVVGLIPNRMMPLRLYFRQGGCLDTVTSIFELAKVARMIRVASHWQPCRYRDWQSEFVSRLPWQPVALRSTD